MQNYTVKIRLKTWWLRFRREEDVGKALKRKVLTCSAEAMLVSLGIHLLLFFFAGSTVLWSVVSKQAVAFKGEKIERSRLEQRSEPLPVNIEQLQKKVPQPKMSSRVVSASAGPVTIPPMAPPEMGFKLAGKVTELKALSSSSMPGNLEIGISGVNFFGARSKGEKIVFILDASKQMMEDAKGGYNTYKFAKDKVHFLVDAMPAATLFNVMVYSDSSVDMFRPQLVPATEANRNALKAWLTPINSDPYNVGKVASKYTAPVSYQSNIGSGARFWLKAVQASMEQTADTVFVMCASFGRYSASTPRSSGDRATAVEPDPKQMEDYRAKVAAVNAKAQKTFAAENVARAERGLPPKIVYDWNNYMTQELRLVMPTRPSSPGGGGGGGGGVAMTPEELVQDHLDAVWSYQYTARELPAPRLNFVYLIAKDASTQREYEDISALRHIADAFRGDFEFLRGSKTMRNLIQ
jgi:hypothetical protein